MKHRCGLSVRGSFPKLDCPCDPCLSSFNSGIYCIKHLLQFCPGKPQPRCFLCLGLTLLSCDLFREMRQQAPVSRPMRTHGLPPRSFWSICLLLLLLFSSHNFLRSVQPTNKLMIFQTDNFATATENRIYTHKNIFYIYVKQFMERCTSNVIMA